MVLLKNASLLEVHNNYSIDITSNSDPCFIPNNIANRVALRYYCLVTRVGVSPLLSLWSVIACIVNIAAFCKMGLKEGVTQNFLILSIADGLQGLLHVALDICFQLRLFCFRFKMVSQTTLVFHLSMLGPFPLSVSTITTAVIAVVRCCCVTMPFTVQRTFTARRQLIAILALCGANSVSLIYFSTRATLDRLNTSAYRSERAIHLHKSSIFMYDVARVSVFSICYSVTLVSMLILIGTLMKSSRFQHSISTVDLPASGDGRNSRDAHVIKSIFQVLAIFTLCNFLSVFQSLGRLIMSQPSFWQEDSKVEGYLIDSLSEILLQINTGINIFVYYQSNSRFRAIVNRFLRRHN